MNQGKYIYIHPYSSYLFNIREFKTVIPNYILHRPNKQFNTNQLKLIVNWNLNNFPDKPILQRKNKYKLNKIVYVLAALLQIIKLCGLTKNITTFANRFQII